MNPDLEALVKALDLYFQELGGPEAENRLADFHASLDIYCALHKLDRNLLQRAVQLQYRRWRWTTDQRFPSIPPKA